MPHADPEQRAEYNRAWKAAHPVQRAAYSRTTYSRSRVGRIQQMREYVLRKKYGITEAQYGEMLARQNGVCAICKKAHRSGVRLSVDHDHETGRVRGLLCKGCNSKVEKFLDYIRAAETPAA